MSVAAAGICLLKCFCRCFCWTFSAKPDPRMPCSSVQTYTKKCWGVIKPVPRRHVGGILNETKEWVEMRQCEFLCRKYSQTCIPTVNIYNISNSKPKKFAGKHNFTTEHCNCNKVGLCLQHGGNKYRLDSMIVAVTPSLDCFCSEAKVISRTCTQQGVMFQHLQLHEIVAKLLQ